MSIRAATRRQCPPTPASACSTWPFFSWIRPIGETVAACSFLVSLRSCGCLCLFTESISPAELLVPSLSTPRLPSPPPTSLEVLQVYKRLRIGPWLRVYKRPEYEHSPRVLLKRFNLRIRCPLCEGRITCSNKPRLHSWMLYSRLPTGPLSQRDTFWEQFQPCVSKPFCSGLPVSASCFHFSLPPKKDDYSSSSFFSMNQCIVLYTKRRKKSKIPMTYDMNTKPQNDSHFMKHLQIICVICSFQKVKSWCRKMYI